MSALRHRLAVRILQIDGIVKLRRERPFTHTRGVRLDHADHAVDVARGKSAADARTTGGRVGRRHERIRAEVDVEHRALRPFEEDGLARLLRFMEHRHGIADVRRKLLLNYLVDGNQFVRIELIALDRTTRHLDGIPFIHALCLKRAELRVRLLHLFADEIEEPVREHIAAAESRTRDLDGVGGTDAASRGADLLAGRAGGLLGLVERTVVQHHRSLR